MLMQWLTSSADIETCELNDEQLSALAKKTLILITTVGPYGLYGEHVRIISQRESKAKVHARLTLSRPSKLALKTARTTST